jgi:hypothetical protein
MSQDMLSGAMDATQAALTRAMKLVEQLVAQGRGEEARAALAKCRRQAAGLIACLSPSKPRDQAYRQVLEQELGTLEKAVGKAARPAGRRKLTKTLLVAGALAVLIGFAVLLV